VVALVEFPVTSTCSRTGWLKYAQMRTMVEYLPTKLGHKNGVNVGVHIPAWSIWDVRNMRDTTIFYRYLNGKNMEHLMIMHDHPLEFYWVAHF